MKAIVVEQLSDGTPFIKGQTLYDAAENMKSAQEYIDYLLANPAIQIDKSK